MSAPVASEIRRPLSASRADQRVVSCSPEAGDDEHGADFVAIEPSGMRFVVELWTSHMCSGRLGDEVFLFGIPVEARHGATSPRDGRASSTACLEVTAELLDVASAR